MYNNGTGNYCIIGFDVYSNFWDIGADGILTMPTSQDSLEGGHAVSICGWDDAKKLYKCVNQWGADWGDHGYFYMPYDYVHSSKLAADFWAISKVSGVSDVEPTPPPPDPGPTPEGKAPAWTIVENPNYVVLLDGKEQTPTHYSAFEASEHSGKLKLDNPNSEVTVKQAGSWKVTLK